MTGSDGVGVTAPTGRDFPCCENPQDSSTPEAQVEPAVGAYAGATTPCAGCSHSLTNHTYAGCIVGDSTDPHYWFCRCTQFEVLS